MEHEVSYGGAEPQERSKELRIGLPRGRCQSAEGAASARRGSHEPRPQVLRQWIEVGEWTVLEVRRDYESRKGSIAEPLDRTADAIDSSHGEGQGVARERERQHCRNKRPAALF